MTTTTTPTITLKKRRASVEWKLDETHYAVLSVHHSPERKAFFARLNQEQEEIGNGYTSRSFMVFSGVNIKAERVARYSDKALRAFLDSALAELEARRGEDEIEAQFALKEV